MSKNATLLTKTTKDGQKFREELIDPDKGFEKYVNDNYNPDQLREKFELFNANQAFIVLNIIDLIKKDKPFWFNLQGEGGSGKSFIIN